MYSSISKDEIRHLVLHKRDRMEADERRLHTTKICHHVFDYIQTYAKDAQVLSYIAFRTELDLKGLHEQLWQHGHRIAIPRVQLEAKQLDWRMLYRYDDLRPGYAGIMEPSLELIPWVYNPQKPLVILLPGLAFDKQGGRLGYGGGYYDRFAAANGWLKEKCVNVIKIAPCFLEQVVDCVPMEEHDVVADVIITEHGPIERIG